MSDATQPSERPLQHRTHRLRRAGARGALAGLALFAPQLQAQPMPAAVGTGPATTASPDPGAPLALASDAQVEARYRAVLLRAQQLGQAGRRNEALELYQSAYALRQEPGLLLEIARLQHQLGLGLEALTHYRRFLIAMPSAPPVLRDEASQAMAQISALLGPPTAPGLPSLPSVPSLPGLPRAEPAVIKRPHHRGMIAAGWTLLSVGYAAAFATGLAMGLSWGGPCYLASGYYCERPSPAGGWTLLIPVAGPLISSIVTPATTGQGSTYALVWTLPWLLTDLPLQLVGLGLIIKGQKTPQLVISHKLLSQLQVRPYSSPEGAGLVASGTF